MQSIKTFFKLLILLLPTQAISQTSYIIPGSKQYHFLDRLEIKTRAAGLSYSVNKPYSRKLVMKDALSINDSIESFNFSKIDRYNLNMLVASNPEWINDTAMKNYLELSTVNGATLKNNKTTIVFSPVLGYTYGNETDNSDDPYKATIGFSTRAKIANAVGIDLYFTGNKERLPLYLNNYINRYPNIPGASTFKNNDNGSAQYFDIRGSVTTTVAKVIDVQIGHDRNFIGNGVRSFFLSDFSGNAAFIKLNTRVWKLNLENLYIKLRPQLGIDEGKYLRVNNLSINAAKWLNVSVFDAIVLGREKQFEMNYLMPVGFLRALEHQSGSPDNAMMGLNLKANLAGKFQVYTQLLLDELKLSEIKDNKGWWANKYAIQLGAKYIDAFGIKNLDLQAEANRVRPFTYTHFDTVSNYSHNNLPLAHPLGANFQEFIGIARYQPINKLYLEAKLVWYKQGLDSANRNLGNNILLDYDSRPRDYGWNTGDGNKATMLYASGFASYELFNNLFLEAGIITRNFKIQSGTDVKSTLVNIGFRMNLARREFDF